MPGEILVDPHRPVRRGDGGELLPHFAAGGDPWRALPQEENVGGDGRAGIGLEGRIGKPRGSYQVSSSGQVAADGRVLFVHGVAAGDQGHDTAYLELVESFPEETIMNGAGQSRVPPIGRIDHTVVPKG